MCPNIRVLILMLKGLCISFNNKALGKCVITSFIRTNAIEQGLSYVCPWTQFQMNYISIFFWFVFTAYRSNIDPSELTLQLCRGNFWWLILLEKQFKQHLPPQFPTVLLYLGYDEIIMKHLRLIMLTVDDAINWRLSIE